MAVVMSSGTSSTKKKKAATPISVSALDRQNVWSGASNDPYHTSSTSQKATTSSTPGWLGWAQPKSTAATSFTPFKDTVGNYKFKGGGAITAAQAKAMFGNAASAQAAAAAQAAQAQAAQGSAVMAREGDWGMNAAARAQVGLIKDWTNDAVEAAGEGAIARGMGRSGSYDAVRVDAAQEGALQAANQMAQAAAEQGRLNQQVAISNSQLGTQVSMSNAELATRINQLNAELATQVSLGNMQAANEIAALNAQLRNQMEINNSQLGTQTSQFNAGQKNQVGMANQQALLQADQIQSSYNQFLKQFGLAGWQANADTRLNYLGFDEGRRQFDNTMAFNMTNSDRDYQLGLAGFGEGQRQFNAGNQLSWAQLAAQQQAAQMQYGGGSQQQAASTQGAHSSTINAIYQSLLVNGMSPAMAIQQMRKMGYNI